LALLQLPGPTLFPYTTLFRSQGSMTGVLSVPNMSNPIQFLCGSIAGAARSNSDEASRLCKEYLGPFLSTLRMNYPDVLLNPVTRSEEHTSETPVTFRSRMPSS